MKSHGVSIRILLAFVASSVTTASTFAGEPANKTAKPFHIQAHRGAGLAAPENTLQAFTLSWNLGVTPEADLRMTKDGVIVCFHDGDLRRVVSNAADSEKSQGIEKLDFARVKDLEVGSFRGLQFAGQRVPALADVFAAMHGRPERLLYLDIKTVDLDRLVALIHEHGVERQVIFASEKYPLIEAWKEKLPESMTLIWNRGTEEELDAKFANLRQKKFAGITHLQIHVFVGNLDGEEPFKPSSQYLAAIGRELAEHGIDFQVIPWECDDPRAFVKLLELGVASFATDYPEITLQAVEQFRRADDKE